MVSKNPQQEGAKSRTSSRRAGSSAGGTRVKRVQPNQKPREEYKQASLSERAEQRWSKGDDESVDF